MNQSDYHVMTTYWPLTGGFYKGDQTGANMKNTSLKPVASLVGKADGTFDLQTQDQKMALIASAVKSGALVGAADPANLSHLQMIQLIRTMIGTPVEYFALENAYQTQPVDMLQAREPIQSTFGVGDYLDPLEEADASEAKFDEIAYNLKKIPAKVYTPIEDIMRTIINPQTINIATTNWALKKKRNAYAKAAIIAGITDNENVGDIEAMQAAGFHSQNRTASRIAKVINDHLKTYDTLLTHIVIGTTDFAKYTENTWTSTGPTNMQFNRVIGAGVLPFPGIAGLTAVVDPTIDSGAAYLIDKMNGARLGEGPKLTRRYYDEERDAEVVKYLDFNQFIIVNPDQSLVKRKFNKKITFS